MSPKIRTCKPRGHKNRPYDVTHRAKCGERFLWRRTFGRKGYNLVTVFERVFDGPVQIMWWDREGMHSETMTNLDGVPVFDHGRASGAAEKLSRGIGRKREKKQKTLRDLAGQPERHTVRSCSLASTPTAPMSGDTPTHAASNGSGRRVRRRDIPRRHRQGQEEGRGLPVRHGQGSERTPSRYARVPCFGPALSEGRIDVRASSEGSAR